MQRRPSRAVSRARALSRRLDPSWVVLRSLENDHRDRCVDLFRRLDGRFGFEEFRRDVEDQGAWTPVNYFSGASYPTMEEALAAARRAVPWLAAEGTS